MSMPSWLRRIIHYAIAQYVARCRGAFHVHPYGASGRYIVMMTEQQYHDWRNRKPTSAAEQARAIRAELVKMAQFHSLN